MDTNLKYKKIISTAWLGMALLIMMMQITDLIEAGMAMDFTSFNEHLKMSGLWLISVMLIINIAVQMIVVTFDHPNAKKAVFVMSILYTAFMIYHQIDHLIGGDRYDIHFNFDILHHTLGVWAIIFSYKWMNLGKIISVSNGVSSAK